MPPEMMVGEVTGAAGFGALTAILIAWLRNWAKNSPRVSGDLTKATHLISHLACLLSAVGIHWMFEGDIFVDGGGGTLTIHVPDVYHIFNAMILYGSNLGTQKGWALLHKSAENLSAIGKLLPQILEVAQRINTNSKPDDHPEGA